MSINEVVTKILNEDSKLNVLYDLPSNTPEFFTELVSRLKRAGFTGGFSNEEFDNTWDYVLFKYQKQLEVLSGRLFYSKALTEIFRTLGVEWSPKNRIE